MIRIQDGHRMDKYKTASFHNGHSCDAVADVFAGTAVVMVSEKRLMKSHSPSVAELLPPPHTVTTSGKRKMMGKTNHLCMKFCFKFPFIYCCG